ncbi:TonB-dependent receptor [Novosphingobium sp. JCM 18896]|uniref:TonB-dependent receptor n=1 Tax=Novosphingobium sp. JCM 18896 TaxID=2989731 RepID=UPI002221DFA5|nr:TonB-dependent receptor [Novosphingobium sp. JCM 18896]MCW1431223.1 TonB-dependent receptor [Novosphingobium sp. JCM 18896]
MNKLLKSCVYVGTALGLSMAAPVFAQEADDAAAENGADIIVTARRVEERLQDVPISITVFNQAQIDNRNVVNATDLAAYTPSLSANARYGSENTSFAIRGFSQEARTTASVGVYFADVVAPRGGGNSIATGDGAGPGSFFDLQNVQVLKGPQGTLFGRNTTGGAVLLVPKKPTADLEGYVEGSVGNYDMRRFQGVLNLPLSDTFRVRLGVDRMVRDGYMKNVSGVGPKDFNDTDYWAVRGSIVAELTPTLENYTIVSYSHSDTNGQLQAIRACNPAAGRYPLLQLCQQQVQRLAGQSPYAVELSADGVYNRMTQWQVINTTTWQASDTLTVKNIASYSQIKQAANADYFGTLWIVPATFPNSTGTGTVSSGAFAGSRTSFNTAFSPPGGTIADQENFTEELQFQGSFGERLTWQAGAYVELSNPLGYNDVWAASNLTCTDRFALQCVSPLPSIGGASGSMSIQRYRSSYYDYGIYSQATFALTEQLKLTGGIRYTWDVTKSRAYNAQYTFSPAGQVTSRLCANPLVVPRTQQITSPEQCYQNLEQKSDAPTWLISLDYTPVNDVMVYAKYARGYRQGSTNPLGAGGFQTFEPERVDTYEIGGKASWRGSVPGFFNVSGFYNDFQNQQLQQGFLDTRAPAPAIAIAPPNAAIVNVGKSRIQGVEVEAGIGPVAGLKLDVSYAYIDSKLKAVTDPVFPVGSPYNSFIPLVVGKQLPFTPKHKYTVSATYTLPLPEEVGEISLGGNFTHVGSQYVLQTAFGTLPSYDLLNFNLNWKSVAGSPIDLSAFVTNVTKEVYYLSVGDSSGFVNSPLGAPRMYGLRLRYSFGK